jgi:hypothetical protein
MPTKIPIGYTIPTSILSIPRHSKIVPNRDFGMKTHTIWQPALGRGKKEKELFTLAANTNRYSTY